MIAMALETERCSPNSASSPGPHANQRPGSQGGSCSASPAPGQGSWEQQPDVKRSPSTSPRLSPQPVKTEIVEHGEQSPVRSPVPSPALTRSPEPPRASFSIMHKERLQPAPPRLPSPPAPPVIAHPRALPAAVLPRAYLDDPYRPFMAQDPTALDYRLPIMPLMNRSPVAPSAPVIHRPFLDLSPHHTPSVSPSSTSSPSPGLSPHRVPYHLSRPFLDTRGMHPLQQLQYVHPELYHPLNQPLNHPLREPLREPPQSSQPLMGFLRPQPEAALPFSVDNILRPDFGKTAVKRRLESDSAPEAKRSSTHGAAHGLPSAGVLTPSSLTNGTRAAPKAAKKPPRPAPTTTTAPAVSPAKSVASDVTSTSGEDVPKDSEDKSNMWPAWVYCTRYSDRPSSGKDP